ncbi:hypothetical protein MMC10_009318 [Thelotrema lepadinum]|nr:hypothetical protein [Thelotrema lepadinum]
MSNSGEDQSGGSFVNPPAWGSLYDYSDDKTFNVGDSINIEWDTTLSPIDLYVWQANSSSANAFFLTSSDDSNYKWEVSLNIGSTTFDTSTPNTNIFFFGIQNTNNPTSYFLSHYFDITDEPSLTSSTTTSTSSTTTSAQSSTSSTTSTTTKTTITALVSSTASSLPTSSTPSSSSLTSSPTPAPPPPTPILSVGAKAGVGVGVSAAGCAILALIFWFCFRARRKRAVSSGVYEEYTPNTYQGEFTEGGFASASQGGMPEKSISDTGYYSNQTETTPPNQQIIKFKLFHDVPGRMWYGVADQFARSCQQAQYFQREGFPDPWEHPASSKDLLLA